jgi:hypothetical protein
LIFPGEHGINGKASIPFLMKTIPSLSACLAFALLPSLITRAQEAAPVAAPDAFDHLELLPAEKLIPAHLRSGDGFVVGNPVATDGYFGVYLLRTAHGTFECHGKEMLAIRIDELRAIREADAINKGDAFLKAAGGAVAKPIEATAKLVRDPKGTIEKVPHGVASLFQRAGKGLEKAGKAVAGGAENMRKRMDGEEVEPGPGINWREWTPGFSKNRNQWAAQLRVDPYTTNPVLAEKLDQITAVTFSTDLVAGVGVSVVAPPLGMVGSVDKYVLTEQPEQIRERVAKELAAIGCQPGDLEAFFANTAFTPTLQARFAQALASLKGTANLAAALGLATDVQSETQARFLCASLEALAAKRAAPDAYKSLVAIAPLPAVVRADGSLLVPAPLDVLPWTPATEAFVKRAEVYPKRVLLLPSQTTTNARLRLAAMGWTFE